MNSYLLNSIIKLGLLLTTIGAIIKAPEIIVAAVIISYGISMGFMVGRSYRGLPIDEENIFEKPMEEI